jgi:Ornithine cyclodeaminase/mu-crystallin family
MASLDLVENGFIGVMFWTRPDLSHDLVEVSSVATQVKIKAGVLPEALMGALAVIWLMRWGNKTPCVTGGLRPPAPSSPNMSCDLVFALRLMSLALDKSAKIFAPRGGLAAYSITSSAMENTPGGMVRPSALTVLRLITASRSLEDAVADADIIVTATWARSPFLIPGMVKQGARKKRSLPRVLSQAESRNKQLSSRRLRIHSTSAEQ